MLVIGGCSMVSDSDEGQVSGVLGYNPGDRSWKELPRLLKARSGPDFTVAVVAGDVLAIGGYGRYLSPLTSVERYNRRSRCWEVGVVQCVVRPPWWSRFERPQGSGGIRK
uniref:Uncharacterized protein n=1 Tax=Eutreptiella gymnastica TaxID=73025 RepID=A0A7S1IC19_9EUGL|mmetsp:Transcript_146132/g.255180  ORF Transcript_146132/g.255180 Transcript_146132/m.255180 type:complete len:110 (+) Transcript_146132:101-430(+)